MRRDRLYRESFLSGELGETWLGRLKNELRFEGLKRGLNGYIDESGAVRRRPGSYRRIKTASATENMVWFRVSDGRNFRIVFRNLSVAIYGETGGQLASFAAPWTAEDAKTMTIEPGASAVYVVSQSFFPQAITFNPLDDSWSIANYAFETLASGESKEPYYRFGQPGVTMTVSAFTGTVSITFSADVLTNDHVGSKIRYVGECAILITAVTGPRNATGTVLKQLYPTVYLKVTPDTGELATSTPTQSMRVGDIANTDVTGLTLQITNILSDQELEAIVLNGYTLPESNLGNNAGGENFSTPDVTVKIYLVGTRNTPAPSNIWDEPLISAARGYPGTFAIHRARSIFAAFPKASNLLAASGTGASGNFDVGDANDTDAFIEKVGDDPNAQIFHIVSQETLLIFTDRSVYYVPENLEVSFTPTSVRFDYISPDGASRTSPVRVPDGVAYVDTGGRILVAMQTGTTRRAWLITNAAEHGYHTLKSPVVLRYCTGIEGRRENLLMVLNADGTMAVLFRQRGEEKAGWMPWEVGPGSTITAIAADHTLATIAINRGGIHSICDLSFGYSIDSACTLAETVSIDIGNGEHVAIAATSMQLTYVGETVHIARRRGDGEPFIVMEEGVVDAFGDPAGLTETPLQIGYDFGIDWILPSPVNEYSGRQARGLGRCAIDAVHSGPFHVNGQLQAAYDFDESVAQPPQVISREWECYGGIGDNQAELQISQDVGVGAPLVVRSITMEVLTR